MAAGPQACGRIGSLDGLRGLAILGVMAFHGDVLFDGQFGAPGDVILSRGFGAGWIGVQLFFVLSGFLITSILLDRKRRYGLGDYLSGFYVRRSFRILPLYYGFLLLYFLLLRRLPGINAPTSLYSADSASLFLFYYNLRAGFLDRAAPVLHMYWSLCVEEQFYLLWPLLVWWLSARSLRWVCGVVFAGALLFRLAVLRQPHGMPIAYLATPSVLDAPALGSLIALLRDDEVTWRRTPQLSGWLVVLFASAVLAIVMAVGHFYPNIDARYEHMPVKHDSAAIETWGISAAILLFGAALIYAIGAESHRVGYFRRILNWPLLRSIGFYSYAMYMFHRVLLRLLQYFGETALPGYSHYPAAIAKPVAIAVLAAATYGVARLSYVVWERPFLRLRNRWTE
jgi:peptidoglycan/LPS O-acetylase OafA/YrhL